MCSLVPLIYEVLQSSWVSKHSSPSHASSPSLRDSNTLTTNTVDKTRHFSTIPTLPRFPYCSYSHYPSQVRPKSDTSKRRRTSDCLTQRGLIQPLYSVLSAHWHIHKPVYATEASFLHSAKVKLPSCSGPVLTTTGSPVFPGRYIYLLSLQPTRAWDDNNTRYTQEATAPVSTELRMPPHRTPDKY